ncbi:MAG TPA: ribonuclease Y [Polyangiaceae bacterium]|nr:ribonuclease Y [Polyangiaceae bacterium]
MEPLTAAALAGFVGLIFGFFVANTLSSRTLKEATRRFEEREKERTRRDEEIVAAARAESERLLEEARARASLEAQAIRQEAEALRKQADLDAKALTQQARLEAAELAQRTKAQAEAEARGEAEKVRNAEAARWKAEEQRSTRREEALREKERALDAREVEAARRERELVERDRLIAEREAKLGPREAGVRAQEERAVALVDEQKRKLEAIAGLSGEEARRQLTAQLLDDVRRASAREAKLIEDAAREEAERRAKRVVGIAIQRYAGDHVQERAVTSVHLPNDEMKGRIIGREGRNIRALQEATGVDFIVDDTPETIVVSSFDPVRREVARLALEKLVADGRIHPTRIEEVVVKSQAEVERAMREAAEQALDELGLTRLHPELARLLGQLRYRYSYAQNVLKHSVECGYITGLMAGELGLNVNVARRAGLLHDIGKAVSHEVEGGHAVIGGQLARKQGEDEIVANAIACHHEDEPCQSVYGHLVTAADALSGARPGARREMFESYIKRLNDLERISTSFAGVERSFAIQAGREVRVMVEPGEVSDSEAALLAREISKKIEDELLYPGQIRVTVVRETRAVDYAK